MTTQEIIAQANLDATCLREECLAEGLDFHLSSTDDWDTEAFVQIGVPDDECEAMWPVYSAALRDAIRAMGGRA